MDRVKRIWYLSHMRAAKVQASLRIRAVSPEPSLLAHTSTESRGTFRQKTRSLAPLNGWACAVEMYHDGMLEDTNSLDGAQMVCAAFGLSVFFSVPVGVRGWLRLVFVDFSFNSLSDVGKTYWLICFPYGSQQWSEVVFDQIRDQLF